MLRKPFRTPLLQKPIDNVKITSHDGRDEPPNKKRRLTPLPESENTDPSQGSIFLSSSQRQSTSSKPRLGLSQCHRPLLHIVNRSSVAEVEEKKPPRHEAYYSVVWRNFTTKKNKTWDGDGVLAVCNGLGILTNDDGKEIGKKRIDGPLLPETTLSIGGKDVQVEALMRKDEFMAGTSFLQHTNKPTLSELEHKLRANAKFKPLSKSGKEQAKEDAKPDKPLRAAVAATKATQSIFKTPVLDSTVVPQTQHGKPTPRHDPDASGAVVMKRPASVPHGKQIVDVVVDPVLSKNLRDHQKEGVKFMYECVMGMRPYSGDGAILADEMGLGKTLQVIALLWTLLKQNPVHDQRPVIKRALIVCPVSLIKNWRNEICKWLGKERIGVFVVEDDKTRLSNFTKGKSYSIMIIGYERLRLAAEELQKGHGFDIIVADEGHRLKTAANKALQAMKAFPTSRRILLSGTPLQNNLSEYFYVVDFVNPGLLGKYSTFKKGFEAPISKGRQREATEREKEIGDARYEELMKITSLFLIRRSAEVLAKYLPTKAEYILFCRPTSLQAKVYHGVLKTPEVCAILQAPEAALQLITILKKVCNNPSLLQAKDQDPESNNTATANLTSAVLAHIPPKLLKSPGASGKLRVLDSLLYRIKSTTEEKVVLVSQYTATLDLLSNLLSSLSYSFLRLDGSTAQSKRQQIVDRFNRGSQSDSFVFLLSAKSGGVGLNLIGASRLVLFDNDWNPSTDLQAMARIHRDGQKNACRIYRLITKGALDEKILQRQATKLSLADSVVDGKVSASSFSKDELRDLYRLDEGDVCQTHELLGCGCGGSGSIVAHGPDLVARMENQFMMASKSEDDNSSDSTVKGDDEQDEDDDGTVKGDDEQHDGDEDLTSLDELVKQEAAKDEVQKEKSPSIRDLVRGTQVEELRKRAEAEEVQEREARAHREKHKMMALMQYRHFDVAKLRKGEVSAALAKPERADGEGWNDIDQLHAVGESPAIEDEVLTDVLRDAECLVSYVFAKSSQSPIS